MVGMVSNLWFLCYTAHAHPSTPQQATLIRRATVRKRILHSVSLIVLLLTVWGYSVSGTVCPSGNLAKIYIVEPASFQSCVQSTDRQFCLQYCTFNKARLFTIFGTVHLVQCASSESRKIYLVQFASS